MNFFFFGFFAFAFAQRYPTTNDLTCGLPKHCCKPGDIAIEFPNDKSLCISGDFTDEMLTTGFVQTQGNAFFGTFGLANFQISGDVDELFPQHSQVFAQPTNLRDFLILVRDDGSIRGMQGQIFETETDDTVKSSFRFSECRAFCLTANDTTSRATSGCILPFDEFMTVPAGPFTPRDSDNIDGDGVEIAAMSTGALIGAVSLNGDPHLRGARGQKYELIGKAHATYVLFSAPQFVVTATLKDDHLANHYVDEIGVSVGELKLTFDTKMRRNPKAYIMLLNKQLAEHGGSARYIDEHIYSLELTICENHLITIKQRLLSEDDLYLDLEIDVPGCHDDFDGVLGQTYQCKYEKAPETFHYSSDMDESFRVKNLTSTFGKFDDKAACFESHHFAGKTRLNGNTH